MTSLSFYLRNSVLGPVRLRRNHPAPDQGERFSNERRFYDLLLERAFTGADAKNIQSVHDVGCRNWSYVGALSHAFPRARLVGVEVDGGRRYWNLHRRIDQAAANAAALVGAEAQVVFGDFRQQRLADPGPAAICFFFPFVSVRPCRKWGLPARYADFLSLLVHAQTAASGDLAVLSVHQGEWEAEIAREAYEETGFSARESVIKALEFKGLWPSSHDAHLFVGRRLAARR